MRWNKEIQSICENFFWGEGRILKRSCETISAQESGSYYFTYLIWKIWSKFWQITRAYCKICCRCGIQFKEWIAWCTHIKYYRKNDQFKCTISGLMQFLATESPLKMFLFHLKSFQMFSRYLSFCFDVLALYQNGLIKKIRWS